MAAQYDREFVRALCDGDPAAERQFTTHFGRLILLKLRSRVCSWDLLEDVRQETFLRVLEALRSGAVEHPAKLGAFVSGVAENVYKETVRDRVRHGGTEDEIPDLADNRNLNRELIDRERTEHVRAVLASLPPAQRRVLRMIYFEDMDRAEVCRRTGLTPANLRVVVHRAVGKLRDRLAGGQ